MENEDRQPWSLIAMAALSLVLGVLALVIAYDAKNTSDDAAEQAAVTRVDARLSRLIDRLGVDEAGISGKETALQGQTSRQERRARRATATLSGRVSEVEREVATLRSSSKQSASLGKKVDSLETQVEAIDTEITALDQKVAKLSRRVTGSAGGAAAP